jgi:hypothetical protein
VTHYVCMFTDISAEKAREQQLDFWPIATP